MRNFEISIQSEKEPLIPSLRGLRTDADDIKANGPVPKRDMEEIMARNLNSVKEHIKNALALH